MQKMYSYDPFGVGRMKLFAGVMLVLFLFLNYMAWLQQQRMGV
jgi:hypothetical protein